jgi:hypothetical protein
MKNRGRAVPMISAEQITSRTGSCRGFIMQNILLCRTLNYAERLIVIVCRLVAAFNVEGG